MEPNQTENTEEIPLYFKEKWQQGRNLGAGSFGMVFQCENLISKDKNYAI